MEFLIAFVVGGLICVVGQLLIDFTKLTPARILVLFVTLGVFLTAVGLYEPLVNFAGAGATVPLTGFGYTLAKGTMEAVESLGFLGAFTGAGLLKGFVVLFVTLGLLDKSTTTYTILNAAGDGVFYFLPIFLAYCAGTKFGAKPFISMAIASALVYPNITALFSATDPIPVEFLGIPVKMVSYTSSVLPIIVVCFVQAELEKLLNRIIPQIVRNIFLPVLDLLILVPLTFIVIGPITTTAANGISVAIQSLLRLCPPLGGALMAGLWPIMILFGIHWAIMSIGFANLGILGYDYLLPLTVSCTFSVAIAALAVFLKSKKKNVKQVAGPASITALVGGVTEPAIYGVLLKFKKPMVMVCIANAVGGAICGAFNVTRDVQMSVNLLTLPAIWAVYGPWAIVAIAVVCVLVFVLIWLFGYNDSMDDTLEKESK